MRQLALAARYPSQLYAAGTLVVLALGALAVSYAAIATLVRGRGSALATTAALIGAVGAFCGAIANVLDLRQSRHCRYRTSDQKRRRAIPHD